MPPARPRARPLSAAAAALLVLTATTACSPVVQDDTVDVLTSFYPLQYVAEEVGGEHVNVTNLTPAAADPHSVELSPARVREMGQADLVVYLSGMQAATDEALEANPPDRLLDTAEAAGLEAGPNGAAAAPSGSAALDPHFWQDPARLSDVAQGVAAELSDADPDHAADYTANAEALVAELDTLDQDYRDGLAQCAGATLVVSHEAFGYLAERYDLVQVGISGIDPEAEPSPARLRAVRSVVQADDVRTVFFEVITSPKVAKALAEDLGIDSAKLDPIEGRSDPDADYMDVMRENLAALEGGLVCEG
ncbi:zinc transport system substrate-binding protein [Promicromonospora umidemergens]|uniref:Zinc ABC transporter substrate-binding protein n=1 Tax=Promicromonospora umidemergens TaxID=629679 RepID=A0ABP8WDI7_9MICO|nr:metal ABC transporter substrate-binding protein [Promicromonospora umidemergens]MCP2285956.1 zinc transport system substrate-binding protein [Promicromonospora umidemergens]